MIFEIPSHPFLLPSGEMGRVRGQNVRTLHVDVTGRCPVPPKRDRRGQGA
jgi:hypothetical protein